MDRIFHAKPLANAAFHGPQKLQWPISVRQVAEVLNLIRHLRDQGLTVVLISHRMPDVFAVADRIVVLRRGRKVADKAVPRRRPKR